MGTSQQGVTVSHDGSVLAVLARNRSSRPSPTPHVRAFVDEALRLAAANVDDLANLILADLAAEVPFFATVDAATTELVHVAVRRSLDSYIEAWMRHGHLPDEDLAAIEQVAMQLAEEGTSRDEVLEGLRIGVRRTWYYLVEQAEKLPLSDLAVQATGQLLIESIDFTDAVTDALLRGFAAYQQRVMTSELRAREDLVDDLLTGAFEDGDELVARGRAIGHDLDAPQGMLLFVPMPGCRHFAERLRVAVAAYLARNPSALDCGVRTAPARHAALVVSAATPDDWAAALGPADEVSSEEKVVVLAVDPVAGPNAIHAAYQRACGDITLLTSASETGVVKSGDLAVYRVLAAAGRQHAQALVDATIGRLAALPDRQRHVLLETLHALWECGGRINEAAAQLDLTPRAVRYRMERLQELTGLDVEDPEHRLKLDLARAALKLFPPS